MKYILIILLLVLTFGCKNETPKHEILNPEDERALINFFTINADYYLANRGDDSIPSIETILGTYRKKLFVEDYISRFCLTLFDGGDGRIGKNYPFILLSFNNERSVIPFDIEDFENGTILENLSNALTKFQNLITPNPNRSYSKIDISIYMINKILHYSRGFTTFQLADTAQIKLVAHEIINNQNNKDSSKIIKQYELYKEFCDYMINIKDSIVGPNDVHYRHLNKYYLVYYCGTWQIYIVAIEEDKISIRYFNPLNLHNLYI